MTLDVDQLLLEIFQRLSSIESSVKPLPELSERVDELESIADAQRGAREEGQRSNARRQYALAAIGAAAAITSTANLLLGHFAR